jgi:HSP20 family molecular chaperone IbpA
VRREGDGDPVQALQQSIDRVFDDFWRTFNLPMLGDWDGDVASAIAPRVDVRETDQEVEVIAELPGMDEGDIDVSVSQGMLTIRGEKKSEREEQDEAMFCASAASAGSSGSCRCPMASTSTLPRRRSGTACSPSGSRRRRKRNGRPSAYRCSGSRAAPSFGRRHHS